MSNAAQEIPESMEIPADHLIPAAQDLLKQILRERPMLFGAVSGELTLKLGEVVREGMKKDLSRATFLPIEDMIQATIGASRICEKAAVLWRMALGFGSSSNGEAGERTHEFAVSHKTPAVLCKARINRAAFTQAVEEFAQKVQGFKPANTSYMQGDSLVPKYSIDLAERPALHEHLDALKEALGKAVKFYIPTHAERITAGIAENPLPAM